jgi:hypothetical protein
VTLAILIHIVPVWLVPSNAYSVLWFFQSLLSLGLVAYAFQESAKLQQASKENIVLVEDNGNWYSLDANEAVAWRMSNRSRVSPFLLWINLTPEHPFSNDRCQWLWVFRDSVSKADFRRLSRIIIGNQAMTIEEKIHYG